MVVSSPAILLSIALAHEISTITILQSEYEQLSLSAKQAISKLLQVAPSQVSVKAKTTEGFAPGKGGIAAQAVVLLQRARRPR